MGRTRKSNTKYSAEFKISVILDMREKQMSYNDTVRKYWGAETRAECANHRSQLRLWERIFLEEGAPGLMVERRGRAGKSGNPNIGRPKKKPLEADVENDLIAENQRLKEQLEYVQMENEYLKKLDALVRAEEQKKGRKPK